MNLEAIETLTLAVEGGSSNGHWSHNVTCPRYCLNKEEVKARNQTERFTCFDVAEKVESDHDVLFAGRSTGVVVFWRLAPRNTFGGTNKNDRIENVLSTSMPHKGAISCLTHTQPTTYAALGSPLVFSGATDCAIKVWNAWGAATSEETCLQTMVEHGGGVTGLAFAANATLISISRDGNTRLWRPQLGREVLRFPLFGCVKCLSMRSNIAGSMGHSFGYAGDSLGVWPTVVCVAGGEEWTMYCGDSDGAISVYQQDNASVATCLDGAHKWASGIERAKFTSLEVALRRRLDHVHSLGVTELELVLEHNFIISLGNDGACCVVDYIQGTTFTKIKNDRHRLFSAVAWDLAHEQLILADTSGEVQVWNAYTGLILFREKVARAVPATGPRRGAGSPALLGFHWSKTESVLYGMSPAEDCFFRWNVVKVEGYETLGCHSDTIVSLGFHMTQPAHRQDAAPVAVPGGSADSTLRAPIAIRRPPHDSENIRGMHCEDWELALGRASSRYNRPKPRTMGGNDGGHLTTVVREEDNLPGLVVLSACVDGTIRAWEALGMSEKYCMQHAPGEEVMSMLVLPGSSVVATGTDKGIVTFWRLDTGASESTNKHNNTVGALAACQDRDSSLLLASADFDGTIVLWTAHAKDSVSENRLPKLDLILEAAHGNRDGTDGEILCLAFVESQTPLLASAGNDLAIRCWGLQNRKCILLATSQGHTDSIETLLADGSHILSGSCDGYVRVWDVSGLALTDYSSRSEVADGTDTDHTDAVLLGVIPAHTSGVLSMATATPKAPSCAPIDLARLESQAQDCSKAPSWYGRGRLIITCGKEGGAVKIWDYGDVGKDESFGRLIKEISSPAGSLIRCVACSQFSDGELAIFAGTEDGSVLRFLWSSEDGEHAWYFFLGFALHEREFTRGYSPSNCIYMKPEKSELIYVARATLRPSSELVSNCFNFPQDNFDKINSVKGTYGSSPHLVLDTGASAVDFTLHDIDGNPWNLGDALREGEGKPVALIWGMSTCPAYQGLDSTTSSSRWAYWHEQKLVDLYGDRAIFVHIYGPEPHPCVPDTNFDSGRLLPNFWSVTPQTFTYEGRVEAATSIKLLTHPDQVILPDYLTGNPYSDLNQPVWCSYAMGARSAVLITEDGTIFYQQEWLNTEDLAGAIDGYWEQEGQGTWEGGHKEGSPSNVGKKSRVPDASGLEGRDEDNKRVRYQGRKAGP